MSRLPKAIVTGFAAVAILAAALILPAVVTLAMLKYRAPVGDTYFVVAHWHSWRILGASLLVFATAFFWQYRRTAQS